MVITTMASPLAIRDDAPPPKGGNLTWCITNQSGYNTVGIHNNFDTQEIDAYIFDSNCNVLTSTNEVLTDSNYTISWKDGSGNSKTGYIYVHDVTGGSDEFWCNGAHYQDGWTFESPLPVYYEYRYFTC
ncbi:hypothetical protein J7T55_013141 [Diaporthe amygdali]|uniref:uncharacterized protein n=1 Tax=Phomopsis amygdali TaxID=1214568 RepID=UPI0022FDB38A|nr:uncharacterized protein J7T55_013141 [Diaporthe amygdali]KAJ0118885.1 hypothetical protein J7T55_013141 [Diaporthe amygdali]